jgi:hypothetical protein
VQSRQFFESMLPDNYLRKPLKKLRTYATYRTSKGLSINTM